MSGWGVIYNNASIGLHKRTQEMAWLQEQAASGQRVLRPSHDPSAAYRILGLRQEQATMEAYMDNLHAVTLNLENASSALQQVSLALSRANELVTQGANDTYSPENRRALATEFDGLLGQCLSLANHEFMGKYLFGGAKTDEAPFQAVLKGGSITDAEYVGSTSDILIPVARGVTYQGTMIGTEVFRVDDRRNPVYYGQTGAANGSGTSSVRGDVWLTFTHDTTTYQDGGATGIAVGASSATGDTILGANHTLTIDADAQTVQLDTGPAVAYSPLTTDLEVTNGSGDVVYVDTSGMLLGAGQQVVPIEATAKATMDDGQTTLNVAAFTDNVAITESSSDRVLYVDTTNLARTGTDLVRVPGTYNLFNTLAGIRDLMLNDRHLTNEEFHELLAESADALDAVTSGVLESLTGMGSRLQALEALNNSLVSIAENADLEAGVLGEADTVEVAIELARAQTFYEMSLLSISKLLSMSLLDFIR